MGLRSVGRCIKSKVSARNIRTKDLVIEFDAQTRGKRSGNIFLRFSQISAWQSATLLPKSCQSVQPVPARVEEPVNPVRQSSNGMHRIIQYPPFPKMP